MKAALVIAMLLMLTSCKEKPATPASHRTTSPTQLASLLTTNSSCKVRLLPPWMGDVRETVRTGMCTNQLVHTKQTNDSHLRFDWFTHAQPSGPPLYLGAITISESTVDGETSFHTYMPSLPSDASITATRGLKQLQTVLGSPGNRGIDSWSDGHALHGASSWSFFTLKDEREIETITVSCLMTQPKADPDWHIEGVSVSRGTARPFEN